jgi:hypothetical protein
MVDLRLAEEHEPALAEWLQPSLQDTAGRDPLGLNTITLDRILPSLIPGVLALSQRGRYFSIYPWMLRLYAERKRPANNKELGDFIRRREYELCLAMKLCRHCRATAAIGGKKAAPAASSNQDPLPRRFSVDAEKGGYGLNYRTPLRDLGAVALAGTPLGEDETPIPIDVLLKTERAEALASAFHAAIEQTEYFRHYERNEKPLPRAVLEELSEHVCLCRLRHTHEERDAVRALLFEPADADAAEACVARRRAFALLLSLLADNPSVGFEDGEFWRGTIDRFLTDPRSDSAQGRTAATWGALAMKECTQDALCSIWTNFCRSGIQQQGLEGMNRAEVEAMTRSLAGGEVELAGVSLFFGPGEAAAEVQRKAVAAATELHWEDLRAGAARENDALCGLVALLVFATRLPDPNSVHPLWGRIAARRSDHQDGLLGILLPLQRRAAEGGDLGDLLNWIVRHFIIGPHETIAYSKLPEATFRFYWDETGRLKFFSPGRGGLERFNPSDDRREAMASVSEDVGFWRRGEEDGSGTLTTDGRAFVAEVFG